MNFYWFLLGVLCVWRLTHLLVGEDGPWQSIARVRRALSGGFWGGLLDCFYCLSLWFAAPVALVVGETALERILLWLALSGGAILLERATGHFERTAVAVYQEDREESDGMLR